MLDRMNGRHTGSDQGPFGSGIGPNTLGRIDGDNGPEGINPGDDERVV